MDILSLVEQVNAAVNGFIWGVPAMACIIGVGLLLSVRTGFVQLRRFGAAMRQTLGKAFGRHQAGEGMITVSGRLHGAGRYGRHGQYRRCGRGYRYRRAGRGVLDVGIRAVGYVHEVCRGDAGGALPRA